MRERDDMAMRDEIARRAARLLSEGRAANPADAVTRAERELGVGGASHRPGRHAMRMHAQAIEESSLGAAGRSARIRGILEESLEILGILEQAVLAHDPDGAVRRSPEIYGRAAKGELDFDPVVHMRVETSLRPHVLASELARRGPHAARAPHGEEALEGLGEIDCTSIDSRYGRIDELRFETARCAYSVLRIPPRMGVDPDLGVARGEKVAHAAFEDVSRLISELS